MKKLVSWITSLAVIATMLVIPVSATEADAGAVNFDTMPIPKITGTTIGNNIAKTMYLLETSTAEKPNTVRIMIEGQSISDGNNPWVPNLMNWLKEKYPTANIIWHNYAIGGFSTQLLCKRVPNDVMEFKPDLMIFYAYGDHTKLEECIKFAREAGAEVMTQNCHYVGTEGWDAQYSDFMKDIARNHKAEYCDIRTPWKKFLNENKLDYKSLLNDEVHLNSKGQIFMLELMKQFFVYNPSDAESVIAANTKVVQASDWVNGKLEVPFEGIGAEIIAGSGDQHVVDVTIDGKKPSEYKECYIRSCESRGMFDTNLGIIKFNSVPQEQKWTVTVSDFVSADNFKVSAVGSVTGDEGSGANSLNGTHLALDSNSFIWDFSKPSGSKTYTFDSILNGADVYNGSKSVVAFGLENKAHTLVLTAKDAAKIPDIKEIRFTNPNAKATVSAGTKTTEPTTEPSSEPTVEPVTEFVENGNFEGKYTENMYDSGLDIPDGWAFWGDSSLVLARGQGEGTSVGAVLKPNTGSQNQGKIGLEYAGKAMDFSATIKVTEPAAADQDGIRFKIHAYGAEADQNYEGTPVVFKGTNTEFEKFTSDIMVPADADVKDKNGKAFKPAFYKLEVWAVSGAYIVDNISVKNKIEEEKTPLDKPATVKIYSNTTKVKGKYDVDGATIAVCAGDKELGSAKVENGKYAISIKKQKPNTTIQIKASKDDQTPVYSGKIKVGLEKPTIKKVTAKSKTIKGSAYKKSKVTLFIKGKKFKTVTASAKGKYSFKKFKKLKKKMAIKVVSKFKAGKKTLKASTTVKVK